MKVFISYKSENRPFAQEIYNHLQKSGFGTWMDVHNLPIGGYWPDEIDNALNDSDVIVGVLSSEAIKSRNVKNEWDWAIVYEKPLILMRYDKCYIPMNYLSINYIDCHNSAQPAVFEKLVQVLTKQHYVQKARPRDKYYDYLIWLYERINLSLSQKIVPHLSDLEGKPDPIRLRSASTPNMVDELFKKWDPVEQIFVASAVNNSNNTSQVLFDDFDKAVSEYKGRILLLGNPGSGKTITLLNYCRDAVVRRLQSKTAPLPVWGVIPTWDVAENETLPKWLSRVDRLPWFVEDAIQKGEALLLLDGLDELGSGGIDPRAEFMNILPSNNQIIVTCRIKDYEAIGQKIKLNGAVTLHPLSANQIEKYLLDQPQLQALIGKDDDLQRLLGNPLLLSFFAEAFRDSDVADRIDTLESSSQWQDLIFEMFIKRRYEYEVNKLKLQSSPGDIPFSLQEIYKNLGLIAMKNAGTPVWYQAENIITEETLIETLGIYRYKQFAALVTNLNLLTHSTGSTFRFVHILLRDFFAYRTSILTLQNSENETRMLAISALGKIADERSIPYLISLLKGNVDKVTYSVCRALARVGPAALPALIELFNENSEHKDYIYFRAANTIELIGVPQELRQEIKIVINKLPARSAAVYSLRKALQKSEGN